MSFRLRCHPKLLLEQVCPLDPARKGWDVSLRSRLAASFSGDRKLPPHGRS
jgi:hypothetical protein